MIVHVVGRIRGQPSGDWRWLVSRIDYILEFSRGKGGLHVVVREAGKQTEVSQDCEIYTILQEIAFCARDPKSFPHVFTTEKWVYEVKSINGWDIGHMA